MHLYFNEIKHKRVIRGKCHSCGKRMQRTVSDYQTLNPWNKNSDGVPKTTSEIDKEVRESVNRLARETVLVCKDCEL